MGIDNADRSKNERERRSMKQTWMHVVFPCYRKRMDKQKDSGKEVGVVMAVMRSGRWLGVVGEEKREKVMLKVSTTFLNEPK